MKYKLLLIAAFVGLTACAGGDATKKLNIVPVTHCENFERYHRYTEKDIEKDTSIVFKASFSQHPESPRLLNVNIIEVLKGLYLLDEDVSLLGEISETPVTTGETMHFIPTFLDFYGVKSCRMYLKVRPSKVYTVHLNYYGDPIFVVEH